MHVGADTLLELAQETFEMMAQIEVSIAAKMPCLPPEFQGCRIPIHGAFDGWVDLWICPRLARTATATMFMMDENETSTEDIIDTVGELANVIAGQVLNHVDAPSQLRVPELLDEAARTCLNQNSGDTAWFCSNGGQFVLFVHKEIS